jgi:type IV pilus biogenesis protein PilP
VLGSLLLSHAEPRAQTIADYSRAQRALLESTMSQAAARSAGAAPSVSATGASAPSVAAATATLPRRAAPPPAPTLQVHGMFASRDGAVAEIVVNGTTYLLGAAQAVPGTAWQVESIATDRVVLARPGGAAAPGAEGPRKVFPLPDLR